MLVSIRNKQQNPINTSSSRNKTNSNRASKCESRYAIQTANNSCTISVDTGQQFNLFICLSRVHNATTQHNAIRTYYKPK